MLQPITSDTAYPVTSLLHWALTPTTIPPVDIKTPARSGFDSNESECSGQTGLAPVTKSTLLPGRVVCFPVLGRHQLVLEHYQTIVPSCYPIRYCTNSATERNV